MPFDAGDIADLYEWSDANSERGNGSPVAVIEDRLGTKVSSFEQLLERELAKERESQSKARQREIGGGGAKPRQAFLKKGARGWWMRNPEAKQKMQKHVLTSVDPDEDSEGSRQSQPSRERAKAPFKMDSPQQNNSPPPTKQVRSQRASISPAKESPVRRYEYDNEENDEPLSIPAWVNSHRDRRTNESVETLGMSGVRQDYVTRMEREADELADFEALERELAAERESYIQEKQQSRVGEHSFVATKEASCLRESTDDDERSLQGESLHVAASPIRTSNNDYDLGGESSMVFDGVHVFRSPAPKQVRQASSRRTSRPQSRPSFAPSEISAISFDDSEPWGDATSAQEHFARLPESPIVRRSDNNSAYTEPYQYSLASDDGGSMAEEEEDEFRDGEEDEFRSARRVFQQGDYREEESSRRGEAPVSSLVQKVFGNYESTTESESWFQEPTAQGSGQSIKQDVTRLHASRSKPPSLKPRRSGRGSGTTGGRAQDHEGADKSEPMSRRRPPTYQTNGMLPVAVEEKLAELEEEVRFYKSETLQLQKKKSHYEGELQKLAKTKEEFARFEEEQRHLIDVEWERERQKMKKEEKMFERQVKLKLSAAASAASRKDRNEIDALKAQIVKLQLDAKQAASKAKTTKDALRQRISELEGKNRELSEEIKFLERDRLDQWKKYELLLKELNSAKQNQREGNDLATVSDVARVGRTAEQLLKSVGLHLDSTSISTSAERRNNATSIPTTPTYSNGLAYNPGRYNQVEETSRHAKPGQSQGDELGLLAAAAAGDTEISGEVTHPGGKKEVMYRDGTKRIYFADGNEKEILPNGNVVIRFTNGDRKEYFPDTGVSVYHYFEAQTKLTTYPDKTKVYEFPNQQIEKSFPDGTTEILFADGIKKLIRPDGDEFSTFPDGTSMLETKDGTREVTLLSGKRVRYYPDGRMALVHRDGHEREIRSDEELKELMETL